MCTRFPSKLLHFSIHNDDHDYIVSQFPNKVTFECMLCASVVRITYMTDCVYTYDLDRIPILNYPLFSHVPSSLLCVVSVDANLFQFIVIYLDVSY